MVKKGSLRIGQQVYKYSMYTKRWSRWYIISISDKRVGLSKLKGGGLSSWAYPDELKFAKPKTRKK